MRQLVSSKKKRSNSKQELTIDYDEAEGQLLELLANPATHLEKQDFLQSFEEIINEALAKAFPSIVLSTDRRTCGSQLAQRFLQKVLYHLERAQLFKGHLDVLSTCKSRIETIWQQWELTHFDLASLKKMDVMGAIADRVAEDVNPTLSETARFFRKQMSQIGYRQLMAIATFIEACQVEQRERRLSCLGNSKKSLQTYTWFKQQSDDITEQYSQSLAEALNVLQMQLEPKIYFEIVPWEVLAAIEQNCLLMATPDYFLRYMGSLLYIEIATPNIHSSYQAAAERLNLPTPVKGYWELQSQPRVQLVHQILEDMARLAETEPADDVWQILWGYDQQKFMNTRAFAATARSVRAAERAEQPNSRSSKLARRKKAIL
jgi:hypothetical protein